MVAQQPLQPRQRLARDRWRSDTHAQRVSVVWALTSSMTRETPGAGRASVDSAWAAATRTRPGCLPLLRPRCGHTQAQCAGRAERDPNEAAAGDPGPGRADHAPRRLRARQPRPPFGCSAFDGHHGSGVPGHGIDRHDGRLGKKLNPRRSPRCRPPIARPTIRSPAFSSGSIRFSAITSMLSQVGPASTEGSRSPVRVPAPPPDSAHGRTAAAVRAVEPVVEVVPPVASRSARPSPRRRRSPRARR